MRENGERSRGIIGRVVGDVRENKMRRNRGNDGKFEEGILW